MPVAVLAPASGIDESSVIVTAPLLLNVSVPKFVVSLPLSPRVIAPPAPLAVRLALLVTVRLVPLASLIEPASAISTRLRAVFVPVRSICESSLIDTRRAVEGQRAEVGRVAAVVAQGDGAAHTVGREAGVVGHGQAHAAGVIDRSRSPAISTRLRAVFVSVRSTCESSLIDMAPCY